jgi:hypothetical protein
MKKKLIIMLTVVAVAFVCKATCLTSNCETNADGSCSNPDAQCVTKGGSEDCGCKSSSDPSETLGITCACLRKDT